MKKQCEATTLASAYTEAHRCLKSHGVKKTGERQLCAHHRAKHARVGNV